MAGVVGENLGVRDRAGLRGGREVTRGDCLLEQRDAVVARHRPRLVLGELQAVVLGRVVRGGDLHAAGRAQVADREVVHRRRRETDVDHVEAGGGQTLDERRGERRRGGPHVARDDHALAAVGAIVLVEDAGEGAADPAGHRFVELARVDPANVVRLEDACHGNPPEVGSPTAEGYQSRPRDGCGGR